MKRILAAFCILMSIAPIASAITIAHRHLIPETDELYSIEFPWYFEVLSTEMGPLDPAVTEYGVDPDDAMSLMKEAGWLLFAMDDKYTNMSVFVEKVEMEGFSAQDLPQEELEEWADQIASAYYQTHSTCTPLNPDDLGNVYAGNKVDFIYWAYSWYDDETKMITEHFSLFEPGYGLDISFMYDTSDETKFTEAYDVTPFIADSVIRHK